LQIGNLFFDIRRSDLCKKWTYVWWACEENETGHGIVRKMGCYVGADNGFEKFNNVE
jgi:hypothetical protein